MVNPGQQWSCCINTWELLRSLLIAAHSLSLPVVASALSFCVRSDKSNKFDSSSELCEDEDEVALIFTSGFTYMLADWFSTRGDKLSRCCRKCSSVSFRRELNISDAFLKPTAPIEFDRHSATIRKGNLFIILYILFLYENQNYLLAIVSDTIYQAIYVVQWDPDTLILNQVAKKREILPRTSTFFVGEFATDRRATSWKVIGEYILLSSEKNPEDPGGVGDDTFDESLRVDSASPKVGFSNMSVLIRPIAPTEETLFSKLLAICHWGGSCIVIPLVMTERRSRFSSQ